MEDRILVADAGNTAIKLAIASRSGLLASFSLPSRPEETADSLGLRLLELVKFAGQGKPKACAISSVTPALNPALKGAAEKFLGCPAYFVPGSLRVPLKNKYSRPEQTGADRLVGAWAARILYPEPESLLIVDFGTAATFDCVSKDAYLGGLIFPGPGVAARALAQNTALLPSVSLEPDTAEPVAGADTQTSVRHGMIFGYKYLCEGLCAALAKKLPGPVMTIATGPFAETLNKISAVFDQIRPSLVLDGLRNLYYTQISAAV